MLSVCNLLKHENLFQYLNTQTFWECTRGTSPSKPPCYNHQFPLFCNHKYYWVANSGAVAAYARYEVVSPHAIQYSQYSWSHAGQYGDFDPLRPDRNKPPNYICVPHLWAQKTLLATGICQATAHPHQKPSISMPKSHICPGITHPIS